MIIDLVIRKKSLREELKKVEWELKWLALNFHTDLFWEETQSTLAFKSELQGFLPLLNAKKEARKMQRTYDRST